MIGARQIESVNALFEQSFVEVDEQADRDIEQAHVAQELSFAHGMQGFYGFQLNKQAVFDQQVAPQVVLEDEAFVFHRHRHLLEHFDATQLKFALEALLVDRLHEPRPQNPVHFNCRPDHLFAQSISFGKESMHSVNPFVLFVNFCSKNHSKVSGSLSHFLDSRAMRPERSNSEIKFGMAMRALAESEKLMTSELGKVAPRKMARTQSQR